MLDSSARRQHPECSYGIGVSSQRIGSLVEAALEWCKADEIDFVVLHASPQGRKLYDSLGFQPSNDIRIKL